MKKLITIAAVMMAAIFAKADIYLYWTVDVGEFTGAKAAQLYGSSGGSDYSLIETVMLGANGVMRPSNAELGVSASPYTNYLVKLYDGALQSLNEIAVSDSIASTDSDLASAIWDSGLAGTRPPMSAYSFSGFVIPEPSSAMLVLLGLGALALRRRAALCRG